MPKLKSVLPKGAMNGLSVPAAKLLADPHDLQLVIALVDCAVTQVDHDAEDSETAVLRIRRIEGVLPADTASARRLMQRAFETRTGRPMLPFDTEGDIDSAFRST